MGFFFNKVERESLKPRDHIYSWREGCLYAHHGIYIIGDNMVIEFRSKEKGMLQLNTSFYSIPCDSCHLKKLTNEGVVKSCLDCFCRGKHIRRYEYGVSKTRLLRKRPGSCTRAPSDPVDKVLHRANYLLRNGYADYNFVDNNCEDFSVYCKTGWLNLRPNGQSSMVSAPTTMVLGSSVLAGIVSPVLGVVVGMGTYATAQLHCDIGKGKGALKIEPEELKAHVEKKVWWKLYEWPTFEKPMTSLTVLDRVRTVMDSPYNS